MDGAMHPPKLWSQIPMEKSGNGSQEGRTWLQKRFSPDHRMAPRVQSDRAPGRRCFGAPLMGALAAAVEQRLPPGAFVVSG